METRKPTNVSEHAEACLIALAGHGFGDKVSLGGAFGLAYYFEYRATHDVDAWWSSSTTGEERVKIAHCLEEALCRFGDVRNRTWGDVLSVELSREEKVVFSFQIASRDGQLEPSRSAPWPAGLLLDSFSDLVAAKMTALVERGAPRDFRDIFALCQEGLVDPIQCWLLWSKRQQMASRDASPARARLAVETHLTRIESYRPLAGITDPTERGAAAQLRAWFRKEFLDALVD